MCRLTHLTALGAPCWFDVTVADVDRAASFYGGLFGWAVRESPYEYHGVWLHGNAIGAIAEVCPVEPACWTTYFAVDDVPGTLDVVVREGGRVVCGRTATPTGDIAVARDPAGGLFGLRQRIVRPGSGRSAAVAGEPCWMELRSADPAAAVAFYKGVFGHETTYDGDHTLLAVDGQVFGDVVGGRPEGWLVHFAIDLMPDAVVEGPVDTPRGRVAVLADPFGARFGVMAS